MVGTESYSVIVFILTNLRQGLEPARVPFAWQRLTVDFTTFIQVSLPS